MRFVTACLHRVAERSNQCLNLGLHEPTMNLKSEPVPLSGIRISPARRKVGFLFLRPDDYPGRSTGQFACFCDSRVSELIPDVNAEIVPRECATKCGIGI